MARTRCNSLAQEIVKEEIDKKGDKIFTRMQNVLKDKFTGTKLSYPDKYFRDNMKFDLGGRVVEAKYFGYAHEHSDIVLWLEKEKIVFAGDIAFNDRLLPIFKITNTVSLINSDSYTHFCSCFEILDFPVTKSCLWQSRHIAQLFVVSIIIRLLTKTH